MEIKTIEEIRKLRDNIRAQIKSINFKEHKTTHGKENEYSFRGLIGGIEALLTDLSTITGAPRKFIKVSTFEERKKIASYLLEIDNDLLTPEHYISEFENLKVLLRNYNVRSFSERQIEFEKEVEEIRKTKLQFQQELVEVKSIKEDVTTNNELIEEKYEDVKTIIKKLNDEIKATTTNKAELVEHSEELETINNELSDLKKYADDHLDEIKALLTESKSNEKLISSFSKNIQERDKKLSQLEQNTEENNKKLKEYDNERKSLLEEAEELIDSAKDALNYKTAEGISASFQEHYNDMTKKSITGWWLFGATLCLIATISLGIWVLNASNSNIGLIIGRVSLLPLPIIGAIFCANQYTKQKNIIEDYAYKMVLSKAIVGFSEQLKENGSDDNKEYIHYIKTALEEIHKDPLRKREKDKTKKGTSLNELVEVAEKIVNMSKLNQ